MKPILKYVLKLIFIFNIVWLFFKTIIKKSLKIIIISKNTIFLFLRIENWKIVFWSQNMFFFFLKNKKLFLKKSFQTWS